MNFIQSIVYTTACLALLLFKIDSSHALEKSDVIRIHVLNCGRMEISDLGPLSDTGEYDGKSGALEDPCFLVQHPLGLLLWDTGLGDRMLGKSTPSAGVRSIVSVPLDFQLNQLGVKRHEITYLAFSHSHSDHTGNANQFVASTWLWQEKELEHSLSHNAPGVSKGAAFEQSTTGRKIVFMGDHDVFGDGQVKILSTPGHTPGHQSLLVKLSSKPVILSGDLYHLKESRERQIVPTVNTSRADTLASMSRIETLAKNLGARVIIQHDPEEFASLPKYPEYLQ